MCILFIYRCAHELNISILYNQCTTWSRSWSLCGSIHNKGDSFSSSPMCRIFLLSMVLMNVRTTPLSINIYENWLWHKSVCDAKRVECKRAKMNGKELYAECAIAMQFESEVVIIAYWSCNCNAFVTTPFKAYTGLSSAIINRLCCVHFCMDDYCSSRNAVNAICAKKITNHSCRCCTKRYSNSNDVQHTNRSPIFISTIDAIMFSAVSSYFISNIKLWNLEPMGNRFDFNEFKLIVFEHTSGHCRRYLCTRIT